MFRKPFWIILIHSLNCSVDLGCYLIDFSRKQLNHFITHLEFLRKSAIQHSVLADFVFNKVRNPFVGIERLCQHINFIFSFRAEKLRVDLGCIELCIDNRMEERSVSCVVFIAKKKRRDLIEESNCLFSLSIHFFYLWRFGSLCSIQEELAEVESENVVVYFCNFNKQFLPSLNVSLGVKLVENRLQ